MANNNNVVNAASALASAAQSVYGGLGGSTTAGWPIQPPFQQTTFPWPLDPPKPHLAVVRIVCWKCAEDEGKFIYEEPLGRTWCEDCYCVKQLGGPEPLGGPEQQAAAP